jgi:hypothetical protein
MSRLPSYVTRSILPLLLVVRLAALSFSYPFAGQGARPVGATTILGSPDAGVNGKFAVGTSSVGS